MAEECQLFCNPETFVLEDENGRQTLFEGKGLVRHFAKYFAVVMPLDEHETPCGEYRVFYAESDSVYYSVANPFLIADVLDVFFECVRQSRDNPHQKGGLQI